MQNISAIVFLLAVLCLCARAEGNDTSKLFECADTLENCAELVTDDFCRSGKLDSSNKQIEASKCALSCGLCFKNEISFKIQSNRPQRPRQRTPSRTVRAPTARAPRPATPVRRAPRPQPRVRRVPASTRNPIAEARARGARIRASRAKVKAARERIRAARIRARNARTRKPSGSTKTNGCSSNQRGNPHNCEPIKTPVIKQNPIGPIEIHVPSDAIALSILDQTNTTMIKIRDRLFDMFRQIEKTVNKTSNLIESIDKEPQDWDGKSIQQWMNETHQIYVDLESIVSEFEETKEETHSNMENMQSQLLHYDNRQNIAKSLQSFVSNFIQERDALDHLINALDRFIHQIVYIVENVDLLEDENKVEKAKELFEDSLNMFKKFTNEMKKVDDVHKKILNDYEVCLNLVTKQVGDLPQQCSTQAYSIDINESDLIVKEPNSNGGGKHPRNETDGKTFTFACQNGGFVSAKTGADKGLDCKQKDSSKAEQFSIVVSGKDVSLKAKNGKFCSFKSGTTALQCDQDKNTDPSTKFTEVKSGGGKLSFQCSNGKYLTVEADELLCKASSITDNERFEPKEVKDDGKTKPRAVVVYDKKTINVELNAGTAVPTIPLTYYIYKPTDFKTGGPVFYCTSGREGADFASQSFRLFEFVSPDYKDAAIVFVDQRFYGESTQTINSLNDLAPLNMKNIVNDHVTLIKFLADASQLNTKNFLVFGGGHGGLIAGHVANHFAKNTELKDYKVLGWSSSSPVRQIRQGTTLNNKLNEMLNQFESIVNPKKDNPDCTPDNLKKIVTFFENIKALTSVNQAIISQMYLDPKPIVVGTTPTEAVDNLKELAVHLRKQIANFLLHMSFPYDDSKSGSPKISPNPLNSFCKAIANVKPLDATTTAQDFNNIFALFGATNGVSLEWKLSTIDTSKKLVVNQYLAPSTYQDCTEQQIAFCYFYDGRIGRDYFQKSRWNNEQCNDKGNPTVFDTAIEAECKGLFREFTDLNAFGNFNSKRIDVQEFPFSFTRVVTTMNKESIFAGAWDENNFMVANKDDYTQFWNLESIDNWEFKFSRKCDSEKMRDVRYLVLRAFACLAGLFKDKYGVCESTLFFDKSRPEDPETLQSSCAPYASADPKSRFPFDGDALFDSSPATLKPNPPVTFPEPPKPTSTQAPPKPNPTTTTTSSPIVQYNHGNKLVLSMTVMFLVVITIA